ncbi:MAG: hypothetical protein J7M34_14300, partial [Anaerolineae bacterium]|nr:hypothetical protein [Anaerolineae bacterium]
QVVLRSRVAPRLVLIDVWGDEFATPERVRELASALPGVPTILLVGTFERDAYASLADRVTALMVRPVRVGEVVQRVRALLPPHDAAQQDDQAGIIA